MNGYNLNEPQGKKDIYFANDDDGAEAVGKKPSEKGGSK